MKTDNQALVEKSLNHAKNILSNECSRSFYDANIIIANLLYSYNRGEFEKETDMKKFQQEIFSKLREMEGHMKKLQQSEIDAASWISAVIGK